MKSSIVYDQHSADERLFFSLRTTIHFDKSHANF